MTYLTTRETCEVLSVSRWTVARLIRDGELTAVKGSAKNSHIRIDEASLKKYIERNKVKASA